MNWTRITAYDTKVHMPNPSPSKSRAANGFKRLSLVGHAASLFGPQEKISLRQVIVSWYQLFAE